MKDVCKGCLALVDVERLMSDASRSKGYRNKCLECLHNTRGNNSTYMPRKHRGATNQEKKELLDELRAVPCMDCGGRFPPCAMDFDHIGSKDFGIMQKYRYRTVEEILAEVAKCEVVCANCHRVRTHNRRL